MRARFLSLLVISIFSDSISAIFLEIYLELLGELTLNMKNRLFLILTTLITLMLLTASCLQAVPSAPEESATPAPGPVVEIPSAEQATPNWIYAIIGIGAALAVVVIVYLIRSRRS